MPRNFVSQTQLPCCQLHASHRKQGELCMVARRLARRLQSVMDPPASADLLSLCDLQGK